VKPIAKKYKLGLHAFQPPSNNTRFTGNGYIQLSTFGDALEPAPHTPTSGPVWDLFAGTVRHAMNDAESNHEPYLVSPFASTGE
jgi:Gly-Xaa carboxypeptidase